MVIALIYHRSAWSKALGCHLRMLDFVTSIKTILNTRLYKVIYNVVHWRELERGQIICWNRPDFEQWNHISFIELLFSFYTPWNVSLRWPDSSVSGPVQRPQRLGHHSPGPCMNRWPGLWMLSTWSWLLSARPCLAEHRPYNYSRCNEVLLFAHLCLTGSVLPVEWMIT